MLPGDEEPIRGGRVYLTAPAAVPGGNLNGRRRDFGGVSWDGYACVCVCGGVRDQG